MGHCSAGLIGTKSKAHNRQSRSVLPEARILELSGYMVRINGCSAREKTEAKMSLALTNE